MIKAEIFNKKFNSEANCLLLINKIGEFFLFSPKAFSKYQGLFFKSGNELFKTLDSIKLNSNIKDIIYNGYEIKVVYDNFYQKFFLPLGKDAIIYETNSAQESVLIFDCRSAYDMNAWGRYYELFIEDDTVVIKYSKKYDPKENSNREYEIYTAIASENKNYKTINNWLKTEYQFDAARNDCSSRYLYEALALKTKKAAISSSLNKKEAIKNAKEVFNSINKLKKQTVSEFKKQKFKKSNSDINLAYNLSLNAINSLIVKIQNFQGVYAGLPWFFQFWTRDTALSAKAFFISNNFEFSKKLMMCYLNFIRQDGLIPTIIPNSHLDSIDSAGLIFLRLKEMSEANKDEFTKEDLRSIFYKLKYTIESILIYHSKEDLIYNNPYETWMDTDARPGARIEIQALQLSMYSFLVYLSKLFKENHIKKFASEKENELLQKVRQQFFNGETLYDGVDDKTQRPNVFLTHYFYPKLFEKKDWEKIFDSALKSLWLEWGGLATIDKNNPTFMSKHTGITNQSYHHGDSWFFLNSLAAICMYRVNKTKYQTYIKKILQASTNEILHKGIFGFHAELSSAEKLEANGCLAQTWSSALYIELMNEVYG